MTDNRTTELCKLLEERGVEYEESQDCFRTRFRFNYCEACGDYLNEIEVMGACITVSKSYLSPEQAIAATLGSERERRLELLVNQLWYLVNHRSGYGYAAALEAIEELGIEVDE